MMTPTFVFTTPSVVPPEFTVVVVTLGGGVVELVYPPELAVDSGPAGVSGSDQKCSINMRIMVLTESGSCSGIIPTII